MATEKQVHQMSNATGSSDGEQEASQNAVAGEMALTPLVDLKHPLQNEWSFWFLKNDKSKSWEENLLEITTFHTVEDFWALYNHIEVSSRVAMGCDYCVFKKDVKPMWEDPQNINGGRWLLSMNKQQRQSDLDNFWLELLLLLVGEGFGEDFSDEIRGAVMNARHKGDKISLWTASWRNERAVIGIGRIMKDGLGIPPNMLGYQSHEDTSSKHGSSARVRYSV